ncbi:inactive leucine-rich repeat receptor-like protein kinase CORYNE isoform X2 [Hevea brasiliensis]|uniref:inactive leucine-rich repeat receptor-like protein kinase CORYNE isoform X2 n=1 Tax=Hevea brasiliensis TaxID=3981 RepID=UPI0025E2F881|nr:inactive leucine-rich repeat receptor-like protein kinase CORYNE isoform X2 [Hevea brasiliensis]
MEKRRYSPELTKVTAMLLLLSFGFHPIIVQCQESGTNMTSHLSTQTPSPSRPPHLNTELKRILLSIVLGVLTGLTGAIICACVVRCLVCYMNRTPILKGPVIFSPKISPKTLQSALASENQLLVSNSNGKYYRTVLDNGLTVAVKRLEPFESGSQERQSKSAKRRIQQELGRLASLRHRNLMSLRAYVRESDRFSLVYDYLPTGSLEDAMNRVRENQLQLGWEVRLRIAVGVVKGLRYLHFECVPQILHYNLKPTNVMLDAEFEPRLADCGLAKLMPNLDKATSGYRAPECFQNCRRDPTDPFFGEAASGGSLGRWLLHLQQAGEAREALDKSILGEEGEEDEILMAVRIAVVCLSDLPADRPSSDELVLMLSQLHSF